MKSTNKPTRNSRIFVLFFAAVFLATLWPIYPIFNSIFPFVLGMPFSLFYQMVLVAITFFGLLIFHYLLSTNEDGPR